MFWVILATFIATSLGWIVFILLVVNWAQQKELKTLKGNKKEEAHE